MSATKDDPDAPSERGPAAAPLGGLWHDELRQSLLRRRPKPVALPPALEAVPAARSIHDGLSHGQVPDTHRFLRLITKLGLALGAESEEGVRLVAARLFAVCHWMGQLQAAMGIQLAADRAYCALVVLFHRRGMVEPALEAYDLVRGAGCEVPICTLALLLDLCAWDEGAGRRRYLQLLEEARAAARSSVAGRRQEAPKTAGQSTNVLVDGLPGWLSAREGHLVALLAAHVAALWVLAQWQKQPPPGGGGTLGMGPGSAAEEACELLREGLALLDAAAETGAAGPETGLATRLQRARTMLARPCARLAAGLQGSPGAERLKALVAGLPQPAARPSAELAAVTADDRVEALQGVLGLLRRLDGRRAAAREDFDELLRSMGKRKTTRGGVVLATFEILASLATRGSAPSERELQELRASRKARGQGEQEGPGGAACGDGPSGAPPLALAANRHLSPDVDSYAAAIEALFNLKCAPAAEELFQRSCEEVLPNPTLYSAMIFGRLGSGDGAGSADALFEMDQAGFAPHCRFIARLLRLMGAFHADGLRIIEHLGRGPAAVRAKLLHTLMEACCKGEDPCGGALEVLRAYRAQGFEPTADTHFALLKALSGHADSAAAHAQLRRLQAECVLPLHPGFEALIHECFGLSDSSSRAGQIMDARRLWVRQAIIEYNIIHYTVL